MVRKQKGTASRKNVPSRHKADHPMSENEEPISSPGKKKSSTPSVMGFLSKVGGAPRQGSTPAKGLLGKISKEDLQRVGRLEGGPDMSEEDLLPPPVKDSAEEAPESVRAEVAPIPDREPVVANVTVPVPSIPGDTRTTLKPYGGTEVNAQQASGGANRRAEERFPFTVQVEYTAVGTTASERAENLSMHGMFILTANPLEVGDAVMVSFAVPQGNLILTIPARVKWVSAFGSLEAPTPGMGVEFTALDDKRRRLLETITQRLRKPDQE